MSWTVLAWGQFQSEKVVWRTRSSPTCGADQCGCLNCPSWCSAGRVSALLPLQGLGNADSGCHLVCCFLFWLSWRLSVLGRIPLILASPWVFVLSSGTWKHVLVYNEGCTTVVLGDWERVKGSVGWHWSEQQKGSAQGSFLFSKCFCQVTLTGQEPNKTRANL